MRKLCPVGDDFASPEVVTWVWDGIKEILNIV